MILNVTCLIAIANLHVATMTTTKLQFNPTHGSGDVVMAMAWISEQNDIGNSESPYCPGASNQGSVQFDIWFRCNLKNFKIANS